MQDMHIFSVDISEHISHLNSFVFKNYLAICRTLSCELDLHNTFLSIETLMDTFLWIKIWSVLTSLLGIVIRPLSALSYECNSLYCYLKIIKLIMILFLLLVKLFQSVVGCFKIKTLNCFLLNDPLTCRLTS